GRQRAHIARRLAAQCAQKRRNAQFSELREHLVLGAGREQQPVVLQRLEVDAALAHQDERPEQRIEPGAEGELMAATRAACRDDTVEPRAKRSAARALAPEFGARVARTEGDEAMVALMRQIGGAGLEHDIGTERCKRLVELALIAAQAMLDHRQPRSLQQREALGLAEKARLASSRHAAQR